MKNTLPNYRYGSAVFCGTVTIPPSCIFETLIDDFIEGSNGHLQLLGPLNDQNYARVSNRFQPNETYYVEVVPIIEYIGNCQQCLNDLLKEKGLLFFGAQGLVLFKQQLPNQIPNGHLLSFDKKENLFEDVLQIKKLPYMHQCRDNITEFSVINFWSSLPSRGSYLLLFYR